MSVSKERKQAIVENIRKAFNLSPQDTGSSITQAAILTQEILDLTRHMEQHPKDLHSRRGLIFMLNKRRKNLDYLKKNQPENYQKVLKELNLRK